MVEQQRQAGRNVIAGDCADIDFWERAFAGGQGKIRMVILTIPEHTANMNAIRELTQKQFQGKIAAVAKFDDEVEELKQAGAHTVFNIYTAAGFGFADHVFQTLEG